MFKRILQGTALAVALATGVSSSAGATPVGAGTWYEFCFGATGTLAGPLGACTPVEAGAPAPPWTYLSAAGGTFTIVDGFAAGDMFDLLDFGLYMGTTSVPFGAGCGSSPAAVCAGTPGISKGVFAFGVGFHSWDIMIAASPFGGGAAYFRIDEAPGAIVPEPASIALLATGLAGIAVVARRRRRV